MLSADTVLLPSRHSPATAVYSVCLTKNKNSFLLISWCCLRMRTVRGPIYQIYLWSPTVHGNVALQRLEKQIWADLKSEDPHTTGSTQWSDEQRPTDPFAFADEVKCLDKRPHATTADDTGAFLLTNYRIWPPPSSPCARSPPLPHLLPRLVLLHNGPVEMVVVFEEKSKSYR